MRPLSAPLSAPFLLQVVVQGAGSSTATAAGLGTYTYSYTRSTNSAGYNAWAVKTVETLPDGNTNTVYTNAYGEVMLKAFHDAASGLTWETYHQYDSAGRIVLTAAPSALTGYDDTSADLVSSGIIGPSYLSTGSGLVTTFDYYSSTTATETAAGGVAGYGCRPSIRAKQGKKGTL